MAKIRIFLDTDVIISSLISRKGASYQLLNEKSLEKSISHQVRKEVSKVASKLRIRDRISSSLKAVKLEIAKDKLMEKYSDYVYDDEDSHVVAGADISKSRFLLTYNIRHYNTEKIKNSLNIVIITPGKFLQYLRSVKRG